ncbi:hypothetical protein Tco_0822497 [Tanacetum coccineum]|uniref:No apical meristem-associated C-terminal domain-containing protein n=1 Tax=Tanacetum coccineum TaxID=301880 RepID=A0ABQ5AG78_9ASTR
MIQSRCHGLCLKVSLVKGVIPLGNVVRLSPRCLGLVFLEFLEGFDWVLIRRVLPLLEGGYKVVNIGDAPPPASVDSTKDEHIPAVNTDELFGLDARPLPPGKQRHKKKKQIRYIDEHRGSSSSSQFREIITQELRLKREAIEKAFKVAKEKDRTVMRLEEMKFLAISTKDLPDDDAYFINEQKQAIQDKYQLYRK